MVQLNERQMYKNEPEREQDVFINAWGQDKRERD